MPTHLNYLPAERFDILDLRHDYGEVRIITVGHLHGRMMSWFGHHAETSDISFR